jgi:hypothetical protein
MVTFAFLFSCVGLISDAFNVGEFKQAINRQSITIMFITEQLCCVECYMFRLVHKPSSDMHVRNMTNYLPLALSHTHTHTTIYIYIYIYI